MTLLHDLEIIEGVVRYLDSYSLLTLLQAVPSLQKHTVLITDHSLPPMFFGGIHFVERRIIRKPEPASDKDLWELKPGDSAHRVKRLDIPLYDKTIDKHPIKLIELAHCESVQEIAVNIEPGVNLPSSLQEVDIDQTSFLFVPFPFELSNISRWIPLAHGLEQKLDQFTSCKWHIGARTFFCNERERNDMSHPFVFLKPGYEGPKLSEEIYPGRLVENPQQWTFQSWGKILQGLETLRLEKVCELPCGLTLPEVAELSIIFDVPENNQAPPIIGQLYAPKLRTFVVHFNSLLPHFKDCIIGTGQDCKSESVFKGAALRSFELANWKLLDHSRSLPPIGASSHRRNSDVIDLSFLSNFEAFVIGAGVPISSIDQEHLQSIEYILWHVNSAEDSTIYHQEEPIRTAKVNSLRIHITGPGVRLPAWSLVQNDFYNLQLSFSSLSLDVSISEFWHELNLPIWRCAIYSSPRLLKHPGNLERILHLTRDDWIAIENHLKFGTTLELTGFEMDFLKSEIKGKPDVSRGNQFWNLILTPAINIGKLESSNYTLDIDIFKVYLCCRNIHIKPLFVGSPIMSNVRPEVSLNLNFPILSSTMKSYPCQLSISPLFKNCILNGEVLSTIPNVFYEEEIMKLSSHRYHKRTRIIAHRWDIPKHSYTEVPLEQCTSIRERAFSVFHIPYGPTNNDDNTKRTALKRWDPIFYNPYVKFPNDPRTYTVETGHRNI